MKKVAYIAAAFSILFLASCQKEEFQEAYETVETQESKTAAVSMEASPSGNSGIMIEDKVEVEDSASSQDDPVLTDSEEEEDIGISIREITYTDSEEDGGDDAEVN